MFLGVQRQAPPNVSKSLPFGSPMFPDLDFDESRHVSAERRLGGASLNTAPTAFALADKCEGGFGLARQAASRRECGVASAYCSVRTMHC